MAEDGIEYSEERQPRRWSNAEGSDVKSEAVAPNNRGFFAEAVPGKSLSACFDV